MDRLIRFLAYEGKVSVICCSSKKMVQDARDVHDLSPTITATLGRVLTATAMTAATSMKEAGESITVQINGGGPVGQIVAVATNFPKLKACVGNSKVELPLKPNGKIDVGSAVGTDGFLNVIYKNNVTNASYNGMVPLVSGEIGEDFAEYFAKSKQKATAVAVGVLINKDGVKASGGYLVSLLPGASDEIAEKIENAISNSKSISQMLDEEISLEDIAKIITGDENIEKVGDEIEPVYECDCSKEHFEKGLIALGREEIQSIIEEVGKAEIECKFCHKKYVFDGEELSKLIF